MSIILTGINMSENCKECKLRTTDVCNAVRRDEKTIDLTIVQENCPIKSVDGLIKEINRKANSGQWSDATVYGMRKAIAIIKEYC